MRTVLFFALFAVGGHAWSQTPMFKCAGLDGEPTYSATRLQGQQCEVFGISHDPRWHHLGTSADGDMVRVDLETVMRDKQTVSLWAQYVHMKKTRYIEGQGQAFITLQRESFNCTAMTSTIISTAAYSETQKVLENRTLPPLLPDPVIPGTIQELVWRWACRPGKP